jgi:uncharacterized delta-60 repeat protein
MWFGLSRKPRPASPARPRRAAARPRLEALEDRLTPSTGGLLDPTFGSGGHVLSSFSGYDGANAVTVQPDGKIVIAGYSHSLVARYNANGSLDTGFGSGGSITNTFNGQAWAVALQPQADGTDKILVVGGTTVGKGRNAAAVGALARFNANGTLDTTFGNQGVATTPPGTIVVAETIAMDGSGRIVLEGYTSAYMAALVRFTANGALDTTFGSGGEVSTNIQIGGNGHNNAIAAQADSKIVFAYTTPNPTTSHLEFAVTRFNANGTVDSGFGSGGVVTTQVNVGDNFGGLAIQGDGKIVVSGAEFNLSVPAVSLICVLRYNTGGALDPGFGTGGIATLPSPGGPVNADGSGVVIQADGAIVAGARYNSPTGWTMAAARVSPNGAVDTGYGSGGWATVQLIDGLTTAIALQPDGRLVMVGSARPAPPGPTGGPVDVALVRFLGSAPQVGLFTASSNPVTSGSSTTLTASNISDGNPNSTITQVAFYYIDSTGTQQVLGYGTSDGLGNWVLSFTVNLAPGTYTLYTQAEDGYGAFGDPLALTLTVQ